MPGRNKSFIALPVLLCLSACGGGGGGGDSTPAPAAAPPAVMVAAPTAAEASRMLAQASFGATDSDIASIQSGGYAAWITAQEAIPQQSSQAYLDARLPPLIAANPKAMLSSSNFYETFWMNAASGQDQLRERVKLALSEIFVVSLADSVVDPRGAGAYYDMLGNDAFGNFRTLLQDVTLHPMMGRYLTSIANQKENTATGQHPDENYAREVMQLMTLGLCKLNADGTKQVDASGNPVPAYGYPDIQGLAKVFTGMSYYSPTPTSSTFYGNNRDPNWDVTAMTFYDAFHSQSEKDFLGTVIPASTTATTSADLKIALDTLYNNPNVGPFIGKQLIQRLVTSNPSPAYVARVTAVFNDNGSGVRGDMGAVVKAILTDAEARGLAAAQASPTSGKLREPVVRLANWMRTFGATSASGNWLVGSTSNSTSLAQSTLTAPSVFDFWRPGFVPPNSKLGAASLTAPEFQVVDEVSVGGWINTINGAVHNGIGSGADIKAAYTSELAVATDVGALLDRLNLMLFYGQMSAALRTNISNAVSAIAIPAGTATQAQIDAAKLQRVKLAVLLSMASAEYLAQR